MKYFTEDSNPLLFGSALGAGQRGTRYKKTVFNKSRISKKAKRLCVM